MKVQNIEVNVTVQPDGTIVTTIKGIAEVAEANNVALALRPMLAVAIANGIAPGGARELQCNCPICSAERKYIASEIGDTRH